MAGAKETPRQKMIGMMYLVFIAMLALNMSKEVLSAFGFMKEEVEASNKTTAQKNELSYNGLKQKAADQPEKYSPIYAKAKEIKVLTTDFYSYLEDLKTKMTADIEDKTAYESMDKTEFIDVYFFKGDGKTAEGKEFVSKINNYRDQVIASLGTKYAGLAPTIKNRFKTDDVKVKDIAEKVDWLKYRYEGFPLIASLTNITQLQANIKNTESEILNTLLGNQLIAETEISGSNYKGIVRLDKSAYFAGEKVKGEVVLGRYDETLVPTKVILNGQNVTDKVQNGQVILDMSAGSVGDKKIKGEITFMQDGKPSIIPFESEYSVIAEPSSAVVSADKMNVVYRGLDNPISVSLPGVAPSNLSISAKGGTLSGTGASRNFRPGSGGTATINVSAKLSSGKIVNSAKPFRVKDIPAASGSVFGEYGMLSLPSSSLSQLKIGAGLPDFVFDLTLNVTKFNVQVPGELTVVVVGNKLSNAAKSVLAKATKGDIVNFYGIEAEVANGSSYKLKKVLPVSVKVSN